MISLFKRILPLSVLFTVLLLSAPSNGQDKKPAFTDIQLSGYFRSYVTFRNLSQNYLSGGAYTPKSLIINGVYPDNPLGNGLFTGYREPLLMLQLQGKPTYNTNLNVDFLIDNQFAGEISNLNSGDAAYPKRIKSYRYLNLGGGIFTDFGKFDFMAGGVIFFNMSPATLWNFEYRDDMFERYPWEWQTVSFKRYTSFYEDKNIARDSRWGSGSIQGFTFAASALPLRSGFRFAYGKSNNTGGFNSFLDNNNQYVLAAQVNKKIASHQVALNYYGTKAILNDNKFDNTFRNVARQNIVTSELKLNLSGLSLYTEAGTGSLSNPIDSIRKWDPLVNLKANFTKEVLPVQLSAQYYYIGPNVVNLTSSILNTSNRNVQADFDQAYQYNTTVFEGAITEFGQLANNRHGVNVSSGLDIKNLKFMLALSSQQEVENKFNLVTFQHRLNGINRSQFIFYRNQIGPYGRHLNQWRRSWEKIGITDSVTDYKKGFNLIDFSVKLKTNLLGREVIFSNYINYNSVQDKFSPIALFSSQAFLRSFYQEFLVFLSVHRKVTLVGLLGMERNLGNNRTDLAENGKPIDQTGYGYGIGLDFDVDQKTGLFLRQKWYTFEDKNFILDRFKGYETTVELKIFF